MRGIQPAEVRMLEILQEIEPANSGDISDIFVEETDYSSSTASNCLKSLMKMGYVSRRPDITNPNRYIWEIEDAKEIEEVS